MPVAELPTNHEALREEHRIRKIEAAARKRKNYLRWKTRNGKVSIDTINEWNKA